MKKTVYYIEDGQVKQTKVVKAIIKKHYAFGDIFNYSPAEEEVDYLVLQNEKEVKKDEVFSDMLSAVNKVLSDNKKSLDNNLKRMSRHLKSAAEVFAEDKD